MTADCRNKMPPNHARDRSRVTAVMLCALAATWCTEVPREELHGKYAEEDFPSSFLRNPEGFVQDVVADGESVIRPFTCLGMPQWMRETIEASEGLAPVGVKAEERPCPTGGIPLPESPPSYDGAARPVPRIQGLNASELYLKYARLGLPVVLEGALVAANAAERAVAISRCCAEEFARKAARHSNVPPEPCDMYDPDSWCQTGVQLCGRVLDCSAVAALDDLSALPPALRVAIEVPSPLPSLREITRHFNDPYIFSSEPEDRFGGTGHFDMLCTGTLSMQHRGRKKWVLWAPWELFDARGRSIPPHTRFEAVAQRGDVIYYPPAWFHETVVEGGSASLTTAVDLMGFPSYGHLADRSLRSPFGYGACMEGALGWVVQSREWDQVLRFRQDTENMDSDCKEAAR